MKKYICFFVLPVFLLLAACQLSEVKQEETGQFMEFYYLTAQSDSYNGTNSELSTEIYELTQDEVTPDIILCAYFEQSRNTNLVSPFPSDISGTVQSLESGLLTVELSDSWLSLSGIESVLARACLTLTITQLPEVKQVQVCLRNGQQDGEPMGREEYLLQDESDSNDQMEIKVYFSDSNGRFLQEETRNYMGSAENLPTFILQELLNGPAKTENLAVLPEGTQLLSVQISKKTCTVDFSEAFYSNRTHNHTQARLTVFSVVDSLTELEQIESVYFLCEGEAVEDYNGLDLSDPIFRQEQVMEAPLSPSQDGSLYVPCGQKGLLAEVPVNIHQTGGRSGIDAILNLLLSFESGYGYVNPFPEGTKVLDVQTTDGLCQVTFNSAFGQCDADPEQARKAIRSVVATICGLDGIDRVEIVVNDVNMTSVDFSEPLTAENDWKLP